MNSKIEIDHLLQQYLNQFEKLYQDVIQNPNDINKLETLVDSYSQFILDSTQQEQFVAWQDEERKHQLTQQLQDITAQCVKQVEMIRARRLLDGKTSTSGYFDNIEHCIDEEFGQWRIYKDDKLLLVGSGAYPMTLIQVAKETGASVIGIDVDSEAMYLGQRVVNVLAPNENIEISNKTVDQIPDINEVTHIIFSSTIPVKYDILDQLFELTNDNVVVAMRYGDDLKSIFNYPSQPTLTHHWQCVYRLVQENQIFDIALYQKPLLKEDKPYV